MAELSIVPPPEPESDPWLDFWTLYPRHEAKKDAAKAWSKLTPAERDLAVIGAADWRRVWQAQGRSTEFIPLPASFIRGERYLDEIPPELASSTSSASHVAAQLPAKSERTAMPDRVRAMLAKIRAK